MRLAPIAQFRKRLAPIALLFLSVLYPFFSSPVPAQAADCQFVLGFAALHDMIPDVVGVCAVDEHHNPSNGDGLQETVMANGATGLLVWRKADNWTAFTDGFWTWINGPFGLRKRLNTDCFEWEDGCTHPGGPPAPPAPSNITVSFASVTGASPGGTASVTVHTAPNTTCRIDYWGPLMHDRWENGALLPKQSDGNGVVAWSWVISGTTPPGNGTVAVNCGGVVATTNIQIGSTPITVTFSAVNGSAPGGNPNVTVQITPPTRTLCSLDYSGPRNVYHWNSGPTWSGWNGVVSWSWPIPQSTPSGDAGTATVTCDSAGTDVNSTTPIQIS